jgi:hypothetical protein
MTSDNEGNAQVEILQLLKKINEAWVHNRPEELEEYFHEDMVIARPGFRGGGRGKDVCVQSYRDFISHATVREVQESNHQIDVWDDTAVASYRFEMHYQINEEEHHDSGVDLFVFARQKGTWRAVWRTIVPWPEQK